MSVSESQLTHDLDHPLVSIVVNNYNNEQYLESCLDALLAQTYRHIEIVVVDAFSSDGSRLLIDSYAERDSRIKKIYCDSYVKYPAITYNIGFLNCNGNYIAINDPDDISMPGRIEAQANYLLTNPAVGAVGCNCYEFNDDFIVVLRKDLHTLENIKELWKEIDRDPKIIAFKEKLVNEEPIKRGKSIIFTESKETAEYLFENLQDVFPSQIMYFSGGSTQTEREIVME
ncbi:MAG: glycosyltransferase, partial [Desulfobacterium sp.]|nr:glycosyltransferase [Desulfobacterium sp.]